MSNTMADLREHLFETLRALKAKENPMDLARARAISEVAKTVIDSAKVEVDFLRLVNAPDRSEFFPQNNERLLTEVNGKALPNGHIQLCSDCRGLQKDVQATKMLPGGTCLCDVHWRKRVGLAATA